MNKIDDPAFIDMLNGDMITTFDVTRNIGSSMATNNKNATEKMHLNYIIRRNVNLKKRSSI